MRFSKNLEANLEHLKQTLSLEKNFDVVYRVVSIGGKKGCLLFVDGLTKDEVLLKIWHACGVLSRRIFRRTPMVFPENICLTGRWG